MIAQRISTEPSASGDQELMKCRDEINQAKELITADVNRTSLSVWDRATQWMELSRPLALTLRGQYGIPRDASNAFFKAIELFNLIGPYLRSCGNVRLFDNACLPGDFVRAAQWWTAREGSSVDWRANSLEGGLDDRFGLLEQYPERWMIRPPTYDGGAMTGDVTDPGVCDEIIRRLGDWRADIYTSDLGFAVQSYFHEEEEHFQAHKAQVELGMRILRDGGCMIVKTFTMSTSETTALIGMLINSFKEFYVVKPATSKPDNSECYWVCMEKCPDTEKGMSFPHVIPRDLVKVQQSLARRQAQKIQQNVLEFRRNKKYTGNFQEEIKRWVARHIVALRPNPPASK